MHEFLSQNSDILVEPANNLVRADSLRFWKKSDGTDDIWDRVVSTDKAVAVGQGIQARPVVVSKWKEHREQSGIGARLSRMISKWRKEYQPLLLEAPNGIKMQEVLEKRRKAILAWSEEAGVPLTDETIAGLWKGNQGVDRISNQAALVYEAKKEEGRINTLSPVVTNPRKSSKSGLYDEVFSVDTQSLTLDPGAQNHLAIGNLEKINYESNFEFPYYLDTSEQNKYLPEESCVTFDNDGRRLVGRQAIEYVIENDYQLKSRWKDFCKFMGVTRNPLQKLSLVLTDEPGFVCNNRSATVGEYDQATNRHKIKKAMGPFDGMRLRFRNESNISPERYLTHEFNHLINQYLPGNPLVREGLAELGTYLFSVNHNKNWERVFASHHRTIFGSNNWNMGDFFPSEEFPRLHQIAGWIGGHAMKNALGDTDDEVLCNYKKLLQASQFCIEKGDTPPGMFLVPPLKKWARKMSEFIPNFYDRLINQASLEPFDRGSRIVWFPSVLQKSSFHGSILGFHFSKNTNFGYSKGSSMPQSPGDFDMHPGQVQEIDLQFMVQTNEGNFVTEIGAKGMADLSPENVLAMLQDVGRTIEAGQYFSLLVLAPDGQWMPIPHTFCYSEEELQKARKNPIRI